jgi:outer membrane protein OmpA-like peptidoglycan-associated protein
MGNVFKILIWLLLAALLGYLFLGPWRPAWEYFLCNDCYNAKYAQTDDTAGPTTDLPLYFNWSNATPVKGEGFDTYFKGIVDGRTDDGVLEINGFYYEGETTPEGAENMGFARGEAVKALFDGLNPPVKIQVRARLVDETEGVRDNPFTGAAFRWLKLDKKDGDDKKGEGEDGDEAGDPATSPIAVDTLLPNQIQVRFPYNSTQRITDPVVEDYLNRLADRMKRTGETARLTGHTDNNGPDDYNLKLGMDRANAVQQFLMKAGVPEAQTTVESKGESQPTAPNDTEQGQAENRRVVIRLIEKK